MDRPDFLSKATPYLQHALLAVISTPDIYARQNQRAHIQRSHPCEVSQVPFCLGHTSSNTKTLVNVERALPRTTGALFIPFTSSTATHSIRPACPCPNGVETPGHHPSSSNRTRHCGHFNLHRLSSSFAEQFGQYCPGSADFTPAPCPCSLPAGTDSRRSMSADLI